MFRIISSAKIVWFSTYDSGAEMKASPVLFYTLIKNSCIVYFLKI